MNFIFPYENDSREKSKISTFYEKIAFRIINWAIAEAMALLLATIP